MSSSLSISDITIRLRDPKKELKSIDVSIGGEKVELQWESDEVNVRKTTLSPPRHLPPSQSLSFKLRVQGARIFARSSKYEIMIERQELSDASPGLDGTQQWQKLFQQTEVILGLVKLQPSESQANSGVLKPITEDILRICPRFRILVIGKTGVGKSSLINKAFGVTDAKVAHNRRGEADINKEIFDAGENNRFVLHDSQGFEHGEVETVRTVERFMQERDGMQDIKDKLHAVWLCLEIPSAGGRLLEVGVENFLRSKMSGALGKVPVIAVLTKYDRLIENAEMMLVRQQPGLAADQLSELAMKKADTDLQTLIDPLENLVDKSVVPHIHVSATKGHEKTLKSLIELTYNNVFRYIETASVVSAIAQKVNPGVKIDASIAVGQKRYWRSLASSTMFSKRTLQPCLDVIHCDIINVWNLNDQSSHLACDEFKGLMSHMVVNENSTTEPHGALVIGLPMLSALAGIVTTLAGPAAPIVLPITACLVLAKWVYDMYEQSSVVLRLLIAYIVDLTLVMQNVFWLQEVAQGPVSEPKRPITIRLIKLAIAAYSVKHKQTVHKAIDQHVKDKKVFDGRDITINKIVELIDLHRIVSVEAFKAKYADMFKDKGQLDTYLTQGEDEGWDTQAGSH